MSERCPNCGELKGLMTGPLYCSGCYHQPTNIKPNEVCCAICGWEGTVDEIKQKDDDDANANDPR